MTTPTDLLDPDLTLEGDTATVRFEQHYDTDAADLWDAVTIPERLARWFAPIEGTPVVGQTFGIRFDDGDVPQARLLECVEGQRFSFEWPLRSGPTVVEVQVRPDGAGSLLVLEHTRLERASASEYAAGWDSYLRYLSEWLAGREPQGWWDTFGVARAEYQRRLEALTG